MPNILLTKRHSAGPGAAIVALLIAAMVVLQLVVVWREVPASAKIFDLGFSFDPYVHALVAGKGFVSCGPGGCDTASRMPGLPLFLAALSPLTQNLRVADTIKVILLGLLVYFSMRGIERQFAFASGWPRGFCLALGLFLVFSPNLIKHAAAAYYEEGYVLELLAILAVCLLIVARAPRAAGWGRFAGAIIAASVCYLFKSSFVLVWGATAALTVSFAWSAGRRRLAVALIPLALAAPTGWLVHNVTESHRFSIMSSTDGENMFRGWNSYTLAIYPRCSLDVLFDLVTRCAGQQIDSPREPGRAGFKTEWAWNDAYKARAMRWIAANPRAALRTFTVKAYNVLLAPRLVPYFNYATAPDGGHLVELRRGFLEQIVGDTWLALGRLIEIAAFAAALYLLARGDCAGRRIAVTSLALGACYAAPYILGFGYERHFSILIMLAALCGLFLFPALTGPRAQERERLKSAAVLTP